MTKASEFPEYATVYSKKARQLRDALEESLRRTLDEIEDGLAENPDQHPSRTSQRSDGTITYKHPQPDMRITYKIDREKKVIYFLHLAAPTMEVSKPLFISYSHKDEKWLLELKKYLKPLEDLDLISIWDDKELEAGDDWRDEIEKALASAKAAVLLISQDFLISDFIVKHELPPLLDAAEKKELIILWIAVKVSTVDDTDIVKYQAVHDEPPLDELRPARRNRQYKRLYNRMKEVVE